MGVFDDAPSETKLIVRHAAYVQLLALPDAPDLRSTVHLDWRGTKGVPAVHRPRYRGRRYRFGGDKLRQPDLKVELEQAYYRHRMVAIGKDDSGIVSIRRMPVGRKNG